MRAGAIWDTLAPDCPGDPRRVGGPSQGSRAQTVRWPGEGCLARPLNSTQKEGGREEDKEGTRVLREKEAENLRGHDRTDRQGTRAETDRQEQTDMSFLPLAGPAPPIPGEGLLLPTGLAPSSRESFRSIPPQTSLPSAAQTPPCTSTGYTCGHSEPVSWIIQRGHCATSRDRKSISRTLASPGHYWASRGYCGLRTQPG